jgi:hypothetical protein
MLPPRPKWMDALLSVALFIFMLLVLLAPSAELPK